MKPTHTKPRKPGPHGQKPRHHRQPEPTFPDRTAPKLGPDGVPEVAINRRGVDRWVAGHPWIYRADLAGDPALQGGEVVRVMDTRGWFLGKAFYSKISKISLRALTLEDEPVDRDFFKRRIVQADELRRRALPGEDTYRVIHGEADLLPGLVVDRYGDYLSAQFLTRATEERKELLADLLMEHFRAKGLMNRSDVNVRTLEGLEPQKGVLRGEVPPAVPYSEGFVKLQADLLGGQKTGAFLDQRENHVMASQYAHGEALDCFSYIGGFALQLATRAKRVTAVEISESAAAQIRANAQANQLTNLEVVAANAFDFLRDAVDEGRKFDTIVLDPPSFAKNKDSVDAALRGYKEINLRAIQLLRPGGVLITASCTYHVGEEMFEQMLESAATDAKRRVQIVERRGAGKDHPVLLSLRETRYLKCFVLRVL
ncbi:MAG TPA: class I SAM-dependent rRNA methyltransferase [Myxococcaceae bacterium]|nr:class I SAM-dependent rRNA methyltransferase [Myxococcaceae bacterium]